MFLLFLAFLFGEGPPDLSRLTLLERLQAPGVAGLFFGLPIAWKSEGVGGLITVAGFGFLAAIGAGNVHRWAIYMPVSAGALHFASWGRLRMAAPASIVPWRLPPFISVSLLIARVGFVLLSANEILGQPPLMTPALHPDIGLAGGWHGVGPISVEFLIHSDTSVTGSVGGTAIAEGHIIYGRSWFGRLLHINSPHRVTGRVAGERFTAPIEPVGDALDGSLFLRNRPLHVTFTRRRG
jgi:hypothetical protein